MTFDANDGMGILRAFTAARIGWDEALDLLEQVEWTTETDSDDILLPDNSWYCVDILLRGRPDREEFRAELVARVRKRRGLDKSEPAEA